MMDLFLQAFEARAPYSQQLKNIVSHCQVLIDQLYTIHVSCRKLDHVSEQSSYKAIEINLACV